MYTIAWLFSKEEVYGSWKQQEAVSISTIVSAGGGNLHPSWDEGWQLPRALVAARFCVEEFVGRIKK